MSDDFEGMIQEYDLSDVPEYRRPIVEEIICAADVLTDGFDTVENIDHIVVRIFDAIVEQHLLDAHLQNLQPESHD